MAIGEFLVARLARVHLLLGVLVIDMILEGVHCRVGGTALAAHEIRALILVQVHVTQQIRAIVERFVAVFAWMCFCYRKIE